MGRLPRDVPPGTEPDPEAVGRCGAALGIPQAAPRPEEAAAPATERGEGQACGDGQAAHEAEGQAGKESKLVHKLQSTQGWLSVASRQASARGTPYEGRI